MIIHHFDLAMVPGGIRSIVYLNQYDEDFSIVAHLHARNAEFSVESGTTAAVRGTKPDGNGYSAEATLGTDEETNTPIVTITGAKQMTAFAGEAPFEVTLYKNGKELSSANFTLLIERAALDKDTLISGSEIRELVEVLDNSAEIISAGREYAAYREDMATLTETATTKAEEASQSADEAEESRARAREIADAIAALDTQANNIARQALSLASNADNEAAELYNAVTALRSQLTQLRLESSNYCMELEVDSAGLVYLLNNGERIAGPYGPFAGSGGGGGGGSSTANVTFNIANSTGWLSKTITKSDTCPVSVTWSSEMDGMPTGSGSAKITVNGAVKATMNVNQGAVEIDLAPYVTTGTNVVRVNISDSYGNNSSINFTISVVALSISSSFDASVPYQGAISFPFTPVGDVNKTVHFLMDGREIGTTSTAVSGRQMTYAIPQQSHGPHKLECYFDCEVNGQVVSSNRLYFEIICLEALNTTPIIVSSFNKASVTQYTTLNVDYTVYDPVSSTSDVVITANGVQAAAVTVDRTQHAFSYRANKVGPLTIVITAKGESKTINLTVTESDINVVAETDQLKLFLSSAGRSNNEAEPGTWTYEDISATFSNFDFTSDGWQTDDNDIPVLRIKGNARLTIPYKIFAQDFRTTGKTIELEFATRNILDYDATIISCMSGGRGLTVTPQRATLKSEQSEISAQFKEDEHIRLAFVVEKRSENRLMLTYINGIASGAVLYPTNDDFSQVSPVNISLGSSDCTLDLYCIRVYDNDLTRHQVLDNWIADTQDVDDMQYRWRHNQVYDAYGHVVIDSLPMDLPYMIISCPELPQYKGDKKMVTIAYTDPLYPVNSFTIEEESCQANVQGTSSAPYARKNYDLQFKKGFNTSSGHTDGYKLRTNSIPFNRFVLKADVASSEAANNVGLVSLFNDASPFKSREMLADSRVRHGIEGYPIVVFWHDTNTNETSFLGKYNFNLPKRAPGPYGFSGNMESWEFQNNTSDLMLFKSDYFDETMYTDPDTGDTKERWRYDYEARFPNDEWVDYTKLQELQSFIVSTDRTKATGDNLSSSVTLDGVTYSKDTAEYRLAKFKAEFGDYAEADSFIFYYIFTELFLMVDSRAKNLFIGFNGSDTDSTKVSHIDRKAVAQPYDMDTALGTNNEGSLVFGYSLEDTDHLAGGADIFNGQQSVLWCNVRDAFQTEIVRMYQTLRSNGILSFANVESVYEERQAKWPEAVWNEDAWFKYIDPLINPDPGKTATAFYLPMLQGSKSEQRKWWLYNRFRYMDSKWNAGDALREVIQLRGYAKADITVTPYTDIYPTIKYGSYLVQQRGSHGVPATLACPLDNVNDTEIYIYSAPQLASIGDLSGLKVGVCDVSMATKLQSLKVGDSSSGYTNPNLTELTLGNNVLLKTLDVRNCTSLTQSVDVSNCTNIEEIYMEGTKSTGIKLPNGGVLKKLHLPATVTNLEVRNQPKLTDIVIGSYENITSLWIENPSNALEAVFFTALDSIAQGARLRAVGLTLEMDDVAEINAFYDKLDNYRGMDEYGNNMDKAQVTGTIHIPSATGNEVAALYERYPYMVIRADHVKSFLTYKNFDGTTTIKTVECADGVPKEASPSGPSRSQDAHYTYTFVGWSTQTDAQTADPGCTTNVVADRTVYAAYSRTVRKYTVTWKNSNGTVLETDTDVPYGTTPHYDGATPQNPTSGGGSFTGWSPAISTVTGNVTYTASYIPTYTVRFYNGSTLLQTVTVQQGGTAQYTGETPVDPNGRAFSGWDPKPTNIQKNTDCYASFDTIAEVPTATSADGAYGVEWDYSSDSPALTRKGLAASFSDPTPSTSLSGSGSSPFDNIAPWKDMKRYNVINGAISHSQDDAAFSETDYDTVVYIPEFYYTAYKDTTNSKWLWAISPTAKAGFVKHPGSGRYVGRFHTSGDSTAVFSKSGVAPLANTSRTNFRTYSHNKGAKWWMLDLASWSALQLLYLVEFGSFNSQDKLGTGQDSGSVKASGGTTGAAYHTVKRSKNSNQYRWVEDPFSNVYDWIDGFIAVDRAAYVGLDNATFTDATSSLKKANITLPSSNFISGFGYSTVCPYAFIPDTAAGSESTYATDRVYSNTGTYALYVGGNYNTNANYGLFYFDASNSASGTSAYLGSRLLYIP